MSNIADNPHLSKATLANDFQNLVAICNVIVRNQQVTAIFVIVAGIVCSAWNSTAFVCL
jgi:hypothetical protein